MLPGYNHNICYKGQTFHIQTEDSGRDHPHIITLLFVEGNIVARKKRDYEDILGFERLEDVVRELMQEQHKGMLRDLKNGGYDQFLRGGAPTAGPQAPSAPPPPPPPGEEAIQEKPASKTLTISEDKDLSDEDIFGADLISDKSLDEVILSFLAKSMDDDED